MAEDPPPIRDLGLLTAAALVRSRLKDHPLVDGNKRPACLGIHGVGMTGATNDNVAALLPGPARTDGRSFALLAAQPGGERLQRNAW